jgi:glutaminyl-tRNA synthetase
MPPKFNPEAPENASLITLFSSLGLSNNAALNLVRTPKQSAPFKSLIDDYNLAGKTFDERQAAALVKLSATGGKLESPERGYVVGKIVDGSLKSPDQVTGMSPHHGAELKDSGCQVCRGESCWYTYQ